jgi:hypothetical protein
MFISINNSKAVKNPMCVNKSKQQQIWLIDFLKLAKSLSFGNISSHISNQTAIGTISVTDNSSLMHFLVLQLLFLTSIKCTHSQTTFTTGKLHTGGPGSVVSKATAYGLDGQGIESRWRRDFLHLSRPALRFTQPPVPGLSLG